MALTKNDLQLIREILQPEFEDIRNEFKRVNKRFEEVDRKFEEQNIRMLQGFREIIVDVFGKLQTVDDRLDNHEERITSLEAQN